MTPPITVLGTAYGRYGGKPLGMHLRDRLQHLYVIGQTGTGKSTLLFNMASQDTAAGTGFCLIDPHGDLARDLAAVLDSTALVWNAADPDCPLGYNPLTRTSPGLRPLVASGLIEALKKQWAEAWGVRMEHLLRHALLALLDQPATDMRDIMRLFLDRSFRREVILRITDPQVRQFWEEEFPALNYKTAFDGVAPIANKLGTLLSHPVVRRALCEPAEPLRFRQTMDEGRVLVVNLAKGQLGADIANVLGGLIVSGITHAAFTRQTDAIRRPFMLYVDEFHSFTTAALADTLAETRKYGLGLTLSQQHCQQAAPEVFASIMGNVGSLMAFRVGALDAPLIARELGGIPPDTLQTQPNYQAVCRLMIDGERSKPFSATTMPPASELS
ncbi:type IV secretory system conjugative DNA transfer family protein [Leisingera sp. ANG59]|uniref:type IV secretory system conjugative DNA transfer family protein n=1 Tax=Leisingera sp. ANG59 TaxID=2675221 RepID=UPI001573FC0A|nr:type IV secretion system DNA-binding domain-containing protein [Leisingera sp. ANG59]NSY37545.1 type IV secretion system DNA-binding domain-containing protein [Leisingera sp. ANG59]